MSKEAEKVIRIVSPEQYKAGYIRYHHNQIPNTSTHKFKLIKRLEDGSYLVKEPDNE